MDFQILISNLTNPTLLFFVLGIIAVIVKSDLEIPPSVSKFISLYLLFAIGFKGGQELAHSGFTKEVVYALIFGVFLASIVPLYTFFILRLRMTTSNAAAVAAAYGSISAVTFIASITFLDSQNIPYGGHMVAVMALMESPAIIMGVMLLMRFNEEKKSTIRISDTIKHSFTNGSVLMIMGSLIIGIIADSEQAQGIKPFTTDIFMGFLAIFLLEMGMVSAKKFATFQRYGWFATAFAIIVPIINGSIVSVASGLFIEGDGNRFIFSILAASASYIAVPAAMRLAIPKADAGLYILMALGITFPFNITIGMPLFYFIVSAT